MASDFTWSKSLLYKYRFLLFPLLYFHMLFIILFLVKIILRFISLFCLRKHRWYKSPDRNPVFEKYLKQKPAKQQQRLRRHNKQRYFFITPVDTFSSLRQKWTRFQHWFKVKTCSLLSFVFTDCSLSPHC